MEGFAAPLAAAITELQPTAAARAATNGAAHAHADVPATASDAAAVGGAPLAAVCFVADEGFSGAPKGLVLQWAAAPAASQALAGELPSG